MFRGVESNGDGERTLRDASERASSQIEFCYSKTGCRKGKRIPVWASSVDDSAQSVSREGLEVIAFLPVASTQLESWTFTREIRKLMEEEEKDHHFAIGYQARILMKIESVAAWYGFSRKEIRVGRKRTAVQFRRGKGSVRGRWDKAEGWSTV